MSYLVNRVDSGHGVSRRGLPLRRHLQEAGIPEILSRVVLEGHISLHPAETPSTALRRCIRSGWLHNVMQMSSDSSLEYIFASKWHRRYVECLLCRNQTDSIVETSAAAFAQNVILKLSPLNLIPREVGNSSQSIPEAQFQNEFYRASLAHTNSGAVSFPEFGNKRGRVDFFVPSKKWGIELLRNGDCIGAHAKRFTEGEYSNWINRKVLGDYVIIDFRTNIPRQGHGEF